MWFLIVFLLKGIRNKNLGEDKSSLVFATGHNLQRPCLNLKLEFLFWKWIPVEHWDSFSIPSTLAENKESLFF